MIGAEVYGYRVECALSEDKGGFGEVYFARHLTSGAEAVLKVLKPEMSAHRDIVTRFFNEARAAAAIQHPGIVAVHNVGYVQDRAYLLMERLRGEDLETRLKRGPLPLDQALRFLRQAAGAIAAAHERDIVHRDLKPANLFLVPDPDVVGGERIKVLDFGIAKLGTGGTMQTQGVFGTPAYMAPEQCSSAADVDARSDLYALGCIAFEMAAGRPPFGHGGLELVAAHLRDEPPPLRSLAPAAPAGYEALVAWLLRKRREDRPQTCAALMAAIDELARAPSLPIGTAPTLPPTLSPSLGIAPTLPGPSSPPVSTTLGAAAGAVPTAPAPPRRRTPWIAIGAGTALAATAVVAIVLGAGGSSTSTSPAAEAAGALAPTPDAAQVAQAAAPAPAPRASTPPPSPPDATPAASAPSPSELVAQADAAAAQNDCEKALSLYERVLATQPDNVPALTGSGECHLVRGPADTAIAQFEAALAVSPHDERAMRGVAHTYELLNDRKRAIAAYHAYLEQHPDGYEAARARYALTKLEPQTPAVATATAHHAAPKPAAAPPPPAPASPTAQKCDEVACIVTPDLPCCPKAKKPGTTTAPDGPPESLDRSMIIDGMSRVKGRVMACGQQYPDARGTVKITVKVAPDGNVTATSVKSSPDPGLGACVAEAVTHAHFAETSKGGSFGYPFPF